MLRIIVIAYLFLAGHAIANEPPIGHVKSVTGDASITTGEKKIKAEVGSPIHRGSVLQTGKKSGMGVTFKDETVMSFGADTVFTVDEYLYSPVQGNLKFSSKLAKGSLNYVSGVIEKLKPDAVTVSTPSGIIGVRGTQFLLKVEE
ncbi:FecR family protein [Dechloromonas sp. A34]|uniref:FecR family protein n=1 Tax=Dechloromonas sp. A34 TaxID=447588 RepID=UPI0022489117|nr:FecR domain-containing protein [Dechloromonas sp. A34]